MSRIAKRAEVVMPTPTEDRKIIAAARLDPDAQPMTARQLKEMVPFQALRGRPKLKNPKQLLSVRYSSEVIEYFRSTGEGWQARMDDVLREYVARMEKGS
jgi:uncharacterized protein (DUF4415 family)